MKTRPRSSPSEAPIGEIRPFFAELHGKLDALPLTEGGKARAVAEADVGFRLNIALTDELAADFGVDAPAASTPS